LSDYKIPAASVKLAPAEVKMAEALIESMRSAFDISDYKDEYTAQLMKFIKAKAKGKKPTVAKQTTKVSDDVSSLLDQLKASLSAPSGKPARKAPAKKSGLKAKPAKRKRKTA
jgi:DNA end-binding protein Ku